MQLNLDTIIIFAVDVEKLTSFYTGILQLEVLEDIKSEWTLLKAGTCKIGLHKIGDEFLHNNEQPGTGSNIKIVFEIDDDIQKVRSRLLSQKVLIKDIKTFDHYDYWLCDGEDPEGNVFQLKQRK